jgi:phosphoglycolate phosphatase
MAIIIFDLDGTLIDTAELVIPAYREAIRHFANQPTLSNEQLKMTFGLPDAEIWNIIMPHATASERRQAYALTGQVIVERMRDTNVLLPHALDVLAELKARQHTLTIASNCGLDYLYAALDTQGIGEFMTHPLCLESVHGMHKADILSEHFSHFDKSQSVMVGDRDSDVKAAKAHGIPAIGCAYGFGDLGEIKNADVQIYALTDLLPLFPAGGSAHLFPHGGR